MTPASSKRVRKNPVLFAEVPQDLLDWLDSLAPPGEKPNRSFHTRQALRMYREGGPEKVKAALAELDELRGAEERDKLDDDHRELLEAFDRLDDADEASADAVLRLVNLSANPQYRPAIRALASALEALAAAGAAPVSGRSAAGSRGRHRRRDSGKG